MGNKRNTTVRVCEIVDGALSAVWGVFCFVAIGLYGEMPILPEYGTIMTIVCILLFCIGCYNLIVGIYIAVKGCTVHGVAIAKIVISTVLFVLTLLNPVPSTVIFYLLCALFDFIMLYVVPSAKGEWNKTSEPRRKETPTVSAPSSVFEPAPVETLAPVSESSVIAPAQTGIQKYIKCPICHEAFIKENEKCCDGCRLEYERLEAASVLRVVSAKGVYNGKEGYKLMDGKWQNVGIAALDQPDRYTIELDFFDSYKNVYERFYKKIILKDSENQAAFERKVNYYGSVKIDLISDPSYTPKPPAPTPLTIYSGGSAHDTTSGQEDQKERNTTVATGKSNFESWRSGMWGLGDEGMKQEYRKFLTKQGYKDTTVNAYVSAINKVAGFEQTDWEGVYRNVKALCRDYDSYGPKAALGAQGHNTVISSLKQFHVFYYKNENKI